MALGEERVQVHEELADGEKAPLQADPDDLVIIDQTDLVERANFSGLGSYFLL